MQKLRTSILATSAAALVAANVATSAAVFAQPTRGPGSVHAQVQAQVRPNTERQRQQAQKEAERSLDREAVAVISETYGAIQAISRNDKPAALAALERATGKANILLARNPSTALIPTDVEVQVIDTAPAALTGINTPNVAMLAAIARHDYPRARALLDGLRSEIRVRTTNLPLATYPTALREAARLLEQGRNGPASEVLLAALNTVVVVDRVLPIPILNAQDALAAANAVRSKDHQAALKNLDVAKSELRRASALGYGDKATLQGLDRQIDALEDQVRRNGNSASAFDRLRSAVDNFFRQQSTALRRSDR